MKATLALLLALAIISVDSRSSKLACYVGSPDDYHVKQGFNSCVAVHYINKNTVELMGLRKYTALNAAYSSTNFSSDCVVRIKSEEFIVTCECFTTMCNIPKTGEQLLEHGFDVEEDN